jgi:hypothetical protein
VWLPLQLAAVGSSIDVGKVVESQPSLLVTDELPWDSPETLQVSRQTQTGLSVLSNMCACSYAACVFAHTWSQAITSPG